MFTSLAGANVNWDVVAGAAATFIVTAIVTALGFKKGLKKIRETPPVDHSSIAGASLMDNMSMMMLTEAIKDNTAVQRDCHNCLLQLLTIAQIGLKRS